MTLPPKFEAAKVAAKNVLKTAVPGHWSLIPHAEIDSLVSALEIALEALRHLKDETFGCAEPWAQDASEHAREALKKIEEIGNDGNDKPI